MKASLNSTEKEILQLCKRAAFQSDNGNEFLFEDLVCCDGDTRTQQQLKGYVSQLQQKGYISKLEECYFDFEITK